MSSASQAGTDPIRSVVAGANTSRRSSDSLTTPSASSARRSIESEAASASAVGGDVSGVEEDAVVEDPEGMNYRSEGRRVKAVSPAGRWGSDGRRVARVAGRDRSI